MKSVYLTGKTNEEIAIAVQPEDSLEYDDFEPEYLEEGTEVIILGEEDNGLYVIYVPKYKEACTIGRAYIDLD